MTHSVGFEKWGVKAKLVKYLNFNHSNNVELFILFSALEWIRDNIVAFGGDPGNNLHELRIKKVRPF